jgi:hypothetical protein
VPNRHFRHFPADLRLRCSRSAEILCINPSDGGPRVRIHLPPAGSQERTPHRRCTICGVGFTDVEPERDRGFESRFLQRRVRCET